MVQTFTETVSSKLASKAADSTSPLNPMAVAEETSSGLFLHLSTKNSSASESTRNRPLSFSISRILGEDLPSPNLAASFGKNSCRSVGEQRVNIFTSAALLSATDSLKCDSLFFGQTNFPFVAADRFGPWQISPNLPSDSSNTLRLPGATEQSVVDCNATKASQAYETTSLDVDDDDQVDVEEDSSSSRADSPDPADAHAAIGDSSAAFPSPIWISQLQRRFLPEGRLHPRRIGHPYQARAPPKHKKPRTSFNKGQVAELEKHFVDQKYLASTERAALAKSLQMSDSQVKTWFQNRRTKWRRQAAEEREQERQATCKFLASSLGSAAAAYDISTSYGGRPTSLYLRPDVTI